MKFLNVHLHGFGKLVNQDFRFSENLNVIVGPNKSGKSTLLQALLVLLYGFYDDGRVTTAKQAIHDGFEPWGKNIPYQGELVYSLTNFQNYRVFRSFGPEYETIITTLPKQRDITDQYRIMDRGRVFFSDEQLGMSKTVFENTCFIRQSELLTLESKSIDAISETLMRLSSSASATTKISDAIDIISIALRDEVGSERAYTKPYAQTKQLLAKLEKNWDELIQKRREIHTLIIQEGQIQQNLQELEQSIKGTEYLQLLADKVMHQNTLSEILSIERDISNLKERLKELDAISYFPVGNRVKLIQLMQTQRHYYDEKEKRKVSSKNAEIEINRIQGKVRETQNIIQELESTRNVPVELLPQIQNKRNQLDRVITERESTEKRLRDVQNQLSLGNRKLEDARGLVGDLSISKVAEMRQQWLSLREKLSQANDRLDTAKQAWLKIGMDEAKYKEIETIAKEIEAGIRPASDERNGCLAILASIFNKLFPSSNPPVEITLYNQVEPIHKDYLYAKEAQSSALTSLQVFEAKIANDYKHFIKQPITADVFPVIQNHLETCLQIEVSTQQQEATIVSINSELKALKEREIELVSALSITLNDIGFEADDINQAIQAYLHKLALKDKLLKTEADLRSLQQQIKNYQIQVDLYQESKEKLDATDDEICKALIEANIPCKPETISSGYDLFEQKYQEYLEWCRINDEYQQALKKKE